MACGLFGKLIAKRDFIAVNIPREVLLGWEAWMQSSIAASKHDLGQAWLKAYLEAPLWRFWLGEGICGVQVMGVFMSSMDGVGRHFPLTVFTFAGPGQGFAVPADGADPSWYEEAEDFLLSTLDAGEDYDLVLAGLAGLREGPACAHGTPGKPLLARHGALIAFGPEPPCEAGDGADAALVPPTAEASPRAGTDIAKTHLAATHLAEDKPSASPEALADDTAGDPGLRVPLPDDHATQNGAADAPAGAEAEHASPPPAISQPSEEGGGRPAHETSPVDGLQQDAAGLPECAALQPASAGLTESLDAALAKADNDPATRMGGPSAWQADFGFSELEAELQQRAARARSFWWTVGGHEHPAMAMIAEGLPDPQLMSLMLTGKANQKTN